MILPDTNVQSEAMRVEPDELVDKGLLVGHPPSSLFLSDVIQRRDQLPASGYSPTA